MSVKGHSGSALAGDASFHLAGKMTGQQANRVGNGTWHYLDHSRCRLSERRKKLGVFRSTYVM
jgi:hypothetical protein